MTFKNITSSYGQETSQLESKSSPNPIRMKSLQANQGCFVVEIPFAKGFVCQVVGDSYDKSIGAFAKTTTIRRKSSSKEGRSRRVESSRIVFCLTCSSIFEGVSWRLE